MNAPEMSRTQAMATARRMYQGDWQIKEIREYLADRGHAMSWDTIKGWADPDWAERRRKAKRDSHRRWWRNKHASTPGFRVLDQDARERLAHQLADESIARPQMSVELMVALRVEDGLTYRSISKISARIYGERLSVDQVRARLHQQGVPKDPSRVRSAAALNERKAAA